MPAKLGIELSQKQQLNQHLVQQMKVLQLNSLELEQYITQEIEANPVLEFPKKDLQEPSWQETEARRCSAPLRSSDDEKPPDPVENAQKQQHTLQDVLLEQLGCKSLPKQKMAIAGYIIGNLDGRGYWTEDPESTAKAFGVEVKDVLEALAQVQQLEPAGVGAKDLKECLLLQLDRELDEKNSLVRKIVVGALDKLAKNQVPALAAKFHTTQKAILEARERIRLLDPKPGSGYAQQGPVLYQQEDAFVEDTGTELKLTVYDRWGGKFVLNQEYVDMAHSTKNDQVKAYLKEQLGKAHKLQQLLAQRQQTMLAVFQALLTHQQDFFRLGPGHKQPLKLADLAEETGFALSTISRALQHKYIACKWGIYAADSFLMGTSVPTAAADIPSEGCVTEEKLGQLIQQVIDKEDKTHPLSDQAICNVLAEQGVKTARRTVNKYRVKLGIPDKAQRKQWGLG